MKRLKEIDFIRAISIIAVIMIHIGTSILMVDNKLHTLKVTMVEFYIYHQLTSFAVSAFLVVSGITLFMSFKKKKLNYLHFIGTRACLVLIPYYIWTIYFLDVRGYLFGKTPNELGLTFLEFISTFASGNTYYHLWFVPVLFCLYLFFPLARHIVKHMNSLWWIVALVALQIAIHYAAYTYLPKESLKYTRFLSYIGLFTIGSYIGNNYDKVKEFINKYIIGIVAAIVSVIAYKTYDFYNSVYILKAKFFNLPQTVTWENRIYVLLLVAIMIYIAPKINIGFISKVFYKVGANSFGIYLIHPFVLLQVVSYTKKYHIDLNSIMIFITLVGIIFVSYAISELINMIPYGYLIVGKNDRAKGELVFPKLKDIVSIEMREGLPNKRYLKTNGGMIFLGWLIFYFVFIGIISWSCFLMQQGTTTNIGRALFWEGIVGQGIITILALALSKISTKLKIFILVLYGVSVFSPIFMFSPRWPLFQDEVYHFQLANFIHDTGDTSKGLLSTLVVARYYPGMEFITVFLSKITNIGVFHAGRLLILLVHSLVVICVFQVYRKISSSSLIAFLGAFIFTVNPSFSFFHSIFSYESMGIFLFVLLLLLFTLYKRQKMAVSIAIILSMFGLTIIHHFSSYQFGLLLLIMTVFNLLNKDENKSLNMFIIYFTLVFSWIIYVATITIKYFNVILIHRLQALFSLAIFEARDTFTGRLLMPGYEVFINRYIFTSIIIFGCILGIYLIYRKKYGFKQGQQNTIYSLLVYGPVLFLLTLPLTLKEGAEPVYRSWPFFFTGISFVVAVSVHFILDKAKDFGSWKRYTSYAVVFVYIGALVMGGYGLGAGVNLLSRSTDEYASGPQTLTGDAFYGANWFKNNIGIKQVVFGDKTVSYLYGNVQYVSLNKSMSLFLADGQNKNDAFAENRKNYIVVDRRITERPAMYKTYFEGQMPMSIPGVPRYGLTEPLPKTYLEKFNDEPYKQIYENGNISIYENLMLLSPSPG